MKLPNNWSYQECMVTWTFWAFGAIYRDARGWDADEYTICFGPFTWIFMRWHENG